MSKELIRNGISFLLLLVVFWQWGNYGNEEDAWTAAHTAYLSWTDCTYHLSRLPGHPVYEYLLRWLWPAHSWAYSALSILGAWLSALGLYLVAKHWMTSAKATLVATLYIITPIVMTTAWQTMEYSLAMATLIWSFYFGQQRKVFWAGLFLALSVGLRLPNLLFGLPLAFFFLQYSWKRTLVFGFIAWGFSTLLYWPVYQTLGWAFFDTYELPYPSPVKVLYKGTIGVYGLLGLLAILWLKWKMNWKSLLFSWTDWPRWAMPLAFLISISLFLSLPEKSAFMLPFVAIGWGILAAVSTLKNLSIAILILLLGIFTFGTDLVDPHRGLKSSQVHFTASAGSQSMGLSLTRGQAWLSVLKAENKWEFANELYSDLSQMEDAAVVCGWWYPWIQVLEVEKGALPESVQYFYYIDEKTTESLASQGISLFFTPEAEIYNRQRYGHDALERYGKPLLNTAPQP